jgi:hypothetical protein
MTLVGDHARAIKAAIQAAMGAGLTLELEVDTHRDGEFGIGLDVVKYHKYTDENGKPRVDLVDWQEVYWEEREEC